MADSMAEHSHQVRIDWDRVFRWSAAFFGIAVACMPPTIYDGAWTWSLRR